MIRLTRLNHELLVLNVTSIAYLERTPDTLVTLTNGDRFHVSESIEDVIAQSIAYYQQIQRTGPVLRTSEGP